MDASRLRPADAFFAHAVPATHAAARPLRGLEYISHKVLFRFCEEGRSDFAAIVAGAEGRMVFRDPPGRADACGCVAAKGVGFGNFGQANAVGAAP